MVLALGAGGLALATVAVAPQVGDFFTAGSVVPPEVNLRPLAERSVAYADNGSVLATFHAAENRQEVRLRRIPRTVRRTILAVEDEDFFQHNGFNLRATARALFENVSAGGIAQGGSTITQQLVKLSLLSPRQDLNRKAREAILAIELEKTMSKQEILERYLNQVYFGGGAYGVQAAAELYWGQDVGGPRLGPGRPAGQPHPEPGRLRPRAASRTWPASAGGSPWTGSWSWATSPRKRPTTTTSPASRKPASTSSPSPTTTSSKR